MIHFHSIVILDSSSTRSLNACRGSKMDLLSQQQIGLQCIELSELSVKTFFLIVNLVNSSG